MPRFTLPFVLALCGPCAALSDQVFMDDLIVQGLACFGASCADGESISGSLELKAQIPTLFFEDTSGSTDATTDWRIAKSGNSLTVRDEFNDFFIFGPGGKLGIRENTPDLDIHIFSVDTPAVRLQQGSLGGNPAQIWDIGANDTNFFIRDLDAGTLPLRIRSGAPQNAIYVDTNGQVGMGLQNPIGALHVRRNQPNNRPHLVLQNRREGGRTELWFQDRDTATDDDTLRLQLRGDDFNITFNGTGGSELQVSKTGDVRIFRGDLVIPNGGVIVGGSMLNVPDYVFADDYELMPLGDVAAFINEHAHLPHVPSAEEIAENGLDMTDMQLAMLMTIEEQMLHMLAQEDRIADLEAIVARLSAELNISSAR